MTTKQLYGLSAPDGSQYVTLTDGAGNLVSDTGLSNLVYGLYSATIVSPGIGAVPGDVITPTGGTTSTSASYLSTAAIIIAETKVVSAAVAAGGSGGTDGTQTVTGTTGTTSTVAVNRFSASVTVSGGAITAILSITVPSSYRINPTSLTNEPVTGASLTGAQLNIVMGASYLAIQSPGSYSILPVLTNNAQATTTGTGTGLIMNMNAGVLAAFVIPNNDQSNISSTTPQAQYTTRYGYSSLNAITTAVENTAFGWNTLASATTGGFNTAVGVNAGGTLTTGGNNVLVGRDAGRNITTGGSNTYVGDAAGVSTAGSGIQNVAVGNNALFAITTASGNVAVGALAGIALTTPNSNTLIGAAAGQSLISGGNNVLLGSSCGNKLTSGNSNTILGFQVASTTLTTGVRNILIGTASNTDTIASNTVDTLIVGASTGSTPWLTGNLTAAAPSATFAGWVKTLVTTVASLPSAATAGIGARAFITDGSTTLILGLGLTAAGGGANKVPVYSDGTNWIVG